MVFLNKNHVSENFSASNRFKIFEEINFLSREVKLLVFILYDKDKINFLKMLCIVVALTQMQWTKFGCQLSQRKTVLFFAKTSLPFFFFFFSYLYLAQSPTLHFSILCDIHFYLLFVISWITLITFLIMLYMSMNMSWTSMINNLTNRNL